MLRWVSPAAHRFFVAARTSPSCDARARWLLSSCSVRASCSRGFSRRAGSGAGGPAVAHGFSCTVTCEILVPGPEMEFTCPALAGGFYGPGPPGKSGPGLSTFWTKMSLFKWRCWFRDRPRKQPKSVVLKCGPWTGTSAAPEEVVQARRILQRPFRELLSQNL